MKAAFARLARSFCPSLAKSWYLEGEPGNQGTREPGALGADTGDLMRSCFRASARPWRWKSLMMPQQARWRLEALLDTGFERSQALSGGVGAQGQGGEVP